MFGMLFLFLNRSMALSLPHRSLVSPSSSSASMSGVGNDSVCGCSEIEEPDPSFDFPSTYGSNTLGSMFEFRGECSGHVRGDELNSVGSSLSSAMEEWDLLPDFSPLFFPAHDSSNSLSNMASSSNGSLFDPLGIGSGAANRELGTATNGELLGRNNESVHSFVMLKNNIPIPQLQLEDPPFETNISKKVCEDRLPDWREKVSSSSCLIETQSRSAKRRFTTQEPETGMSFSSEEEACKFYRKYASENGFRVRLAKVERNSDGAVRKRHFYCSREGFRSNKQSEKLTKYKRKETRTGCPAKVVVVAGNGKWTMTQVSLRHNHELEIPIPDLDSITDFSTGKAKERSEDGRRIHNHGLKVPNRNLDSITDFSTGKAKERSEDGRRMQMENPLLRHDHELEVPNRSLDSITDFSSGKAKERSEDAQNLLNFFRRMQMEDPSFFYSVQVDSDSRLKNFFWRDGRSKLDYEYFGDVLILDSSFRTSRHGVICATFSGLNHHRNRILFGGAFLLDESIDSYIWLSETFMDSMNWRSPKTVFTDENRNTAIAVARIFPSTTTHRIHTQFLCKNAAKNLSTAGQKSEFTSFFSERLLHCQSREEFELAWASFLDGHGLHENPWLKNVYQAREKWSHLFCKSTFSAGVEKTTETNKNISDVFDHDGLSLPEYIKQYEKETNRRRREEEFADFRCHRNPPNTVLRGNSMEEEAASLYTEKIFKIFQDELLKLLSVGIKETAPSGTNSTYSVTHGSDGEKYDLAFDCSNSTVNCSCRKFESIGVLCVHSLKVLNTRNIFNIPPQYVLKRWTKCAKDGVPEKNSEQSEVAGGRFKQTSSSRLVQKALNLIVKTRSIGAAEEIIERHLDTAMKEVENAMKTGGLKLFGRMNSLGERQSSLVKRQKLTQNFS